MIRNSDYRQILRERLDARSSRNARYSLRAFARDLGLTPSSVSQVLSRKQGLGTAAAQRVCRVLSFSSQETEYFCTLVEAENGRSKKQRLRAQAKLQECEPPAKEQLQEDRFELIAEWYHFALLELIKTPRFKSNPDWIARRLDITPIQAKRAFERLKRLKLIREEGQKWVPVFSNLATTDGVPSEAVRKYTEELLEKATDALHFQSLEERDFSTNTFRAPPHIVPLLKKEVREFQKKIDLLTEQAAAQDPTSASEIYVVSTQCFRLTQLETKEKKG